MWYKMENNDQRFVVGGLVSPVMFLGRLNTKIKSHLCRFIQLLQFVYLRWEYSLTLAYYNKRRYIDNMINYTDKTVKRNIRLRADLHFAFSRTVLRELDQSIASEPQDAVGRCQRDRYFGQEPLESDMVIQGVSETGSLWKQKQTQIKPNANRGWPIKPVNHIWPQLTVPKFFLDPYLTKCRWGTPIPGILTLCIIGAWLMICHL